MSQVIEINEIAELQHYRMHWNLLLGQTPDASFFHSLDWLEAYWQHFGDDQKLRVLVVSSGGRPIGFLPLTVRAEKTGVGSVRVLTYPLQDWGWFYGPIGPNPTATLTAAMHYLKSQPRDFDIIDLRWTNTEETDRGRTSRAMDAAGLTATKGQWAEVAVVDMQGSWEDYLASRSPKLRQNCRRLVRRFEKVEGARYERYRPAGAAAGDADPRWDIYDQCEQLAADSWQSSTSDGNTLSNESVRAFFRQTHELAVRAGAVDINLVYVGEKLVAFGYNYVWNGRVSGVRMGFDAEFAQLSPGVVLYAKTLQDSFERGDHTFDFGPGSLEIKKRWLTRMVSSDCYTHYAAPRAQVLRLKRWFDERRSGEKVARGGRAGK
jgi:CelD/BcsL family acetyltransferase involved in cellulose biosynthesis